MFLYFFKSLLYFFKELQRFVVPSIQVFPISYFSCTYQFNFSMVHWQQVERRMSLCILILYPVTQLNSLNLVAFLSNFIGFSTILLSARRQFYFSFPTWMHYISFHCLISPVRTSSKIKNRSGKRRHPCPFPGLSETAFSPSLLSRLSSRFPVHVFYQIKASIFLFQLC